MLTNSSTPSKTTRPLNFVERCQINSHEAAQRFEENANERVQLLETVKEEGRIEAATPEQKKTRLSLVNPNDALGEERINGTNDLLPINYFSRGLIAGDTVCRIHIHRPDGRPDGHGSGFMISQTLLMTNCHVLPNPSFGQRSLAEFNFQYDENFDREETHYFEFDTDKFFYSSKDLDFTLVALKPSSRNGGKALSDFGYLSLTEASGKALAGEAVSLIHHPRGSAKQVSVRNNVVTNRLENFIHYQTDTEPGSSGSPVFNDQWDVVALHRSGVPKRDEAGRILKEDGSVWDRFNDDEDDVHWIANEGVRISSIFAHLKEKTDWTQAEVSILQELGTFSNSDLNESLIANRKTAVLWGEQSVKRPTNPHVPRITLSDLLKKLEDPTVTEQEVAPYFILSDEETRGMDPLFQINPDLIRVDAPELQESALLLNSANWISKRTRQAAYREKKDEVNVIRIISEGDSWFQYPFILHDVIDHLMAEPDLAVLSFGEAGDLIRDMVAKAEFLSAIETENPDFFLISGGGNDLVANGGLKNFLLEPTTSFDPRQLIDRIKLAQFKSRIASDFTNLFSIILRVKPDIKILCHGYSYPVPNAGRWLGKPMEALGIVDRQLQTEILRIIFDEMNDVIERAANSFPKNVFFLDLRNVVPARGWYDELHPTNPFYGDVAAQFRNKIRELV